MKKQHRLKKKLNDSSIRILQKKLATCHFRLVLVKENIIIEYLI